MADIWPTISESPRELQSPALEKSVKTSLAVRWGARHQSVTTTARKARMCRTISPFWTRGQMSWPQMFETYTMRTIASTNKVPSHRCGSYVGLLTTIRACNMVPVRKQSAALPACHDSVDIQPTT